MLRVILELIRIIVIFSIFGALLVGLVKLVYESLGINVDNTIGGWLVWFAIFISLFVLYRNKLQFSGFYKGKGMMRLPRKVSISLISCSVILLVIALFLN